MQLGIRRKLKNESPVIARANCQTSEGDEPRRFHIVLMALRT